MGVYVAVYGLVGYGALAFLALARTMLDKSQWMRLTMLGLLLSGIGLLASAYLTYISLAIIQATCEWCLASAALMLVLFLLHGVMAQDGDPVSLPARRIEPMLLGIGLVIALGGVGVISAAQQPSLVRELDPNVAQIDRVLPEAARVMGPEDAKVTVVEFADYNCRACRVVAQSLKPVMEQTKDRVRWSFRHLPLFEIPGHEFSVWAAFATMVAAEEGKFWEVHQAMFEEANAARLRSMDGITQIVAAAGLDAAEFRRRTELEEDPAMEAVGNDRVLAQELGINATPSFLVFVEGRPPMLVNSVDRLMRIIDENVGLPAAPAAPGGP